MKVVQLYRPFCSKLMGRLFSRRSAPSPLSSPHTPQCFHLRKNMRLSASRKVPGRHLRVTAKFQLYFSMFWLTLSFPLSVCLLLSLTYSSRHLLHCYNWSSDYVKCGAVCLCVSSVWMPADRGFASGFFTVWSYSRSPFLLLLPQSESHPRIHTAQTRLRARRINKAK